MSALTQFIPSGSAKPLRRTEYTSGSGTFTPLVSNGWARVTVVGAGGGGGGSTDNANTGGAGGAGTSGYICIEEFGTL